MPGLNNAVWAKTLTAHSQRIAGPNDQLPLLRERSRSRDNGGRKDGSEAVLKVSGRFCQWLHEASHFLT